MITNQQADLLRPLNVRDVFAKGSYRVPLYQRAYAWTATEIHTLLRDIRDARLDSQARDADDEVRDYYIGSLVVNTIRSVEGEVYEVVDGQQRLTTLFIILAVMKKVGDNADDGRIEILKQRLTFEGRTEAQEDLLRLERDGQGAIDRLSTDGIRHAAGIIATAAARGAHAADNSVADLAEPPFSTEDLDYLLDNVKILRSELPQGTDLNHYFEVMNTRGEQLEKHEILKSRLISTLDDSVERDCFSQVWDACAVLDRHIQTQFSTGTTGSQRSARDRIFGSDWDCLNLESADDLFQVLREVREHSTHDQQRERIGLGDVLEQRADYSKQGGHGVEESDVSVYGAIIDFPNLLLHVLKVQQNDSFSWLHSQDDSTRGVRLEDKYLLAEFDGVMPAGAAWVRKFAFLLLKTRYLMDTYVIRTQKTTAGDDEENWVIQRAFKYSLKKKRQLSARSTFGADSRSEDDDASDGASQRRVLMLQAMFQVTDTRRAAKHYLFQILDWLHHQDDASLIDGEPFAHHLEALARDRLRALSHEENLHRGTQVPNFVFNWLDYELWRLERIAPAGELEKRFGPESIAVLRKSAQYFRFRYRSSVEHFYPVMPAVEQGHLQLPYEFSNHFGNLCIMSRSENSRRNNLMPKAKAEEFASTGQSLKFQIMADLALSSSEWNRGQIREHGDEMVAVISYALEAPTDQQ